MMPRYDVAIIGGGPAGLAAAIAAREDGADALLIERDEQLGGILRQCIHDGFGLTRYGETLTGPEYAQRDVQRVNELGVDTALGTFVLDARLVDEGCQLVLTNREGIHEVVATAVVLAMGCRERTAKQVFIHGERPSGIFTAGCAQNLVNLQGMRIARRVVILGSGDIGLIMARRLTLEGAEVVGVFEAQSKPSGLARNVSQCLDDFDIPLHLSTTVTRTFGKDRLTAVETCRVDEALRPIKGTEQLVPCDALVLSVGLIPENEVSEKLGIPLCPQTHGPVVDQSFQTLTDGVFCAGNCLSVNDLVDYVSENGAGAGHAAARYAHGHAPRTLREVRMGKGVATCVPQRVDVGGPLDDVGFYLRSDGDYRDVTVTFAAGERVIHRQRLRAVRQAETVRLQVCLEGLMDDMTVSFEGTSCEEGERHG